VGRQLPGDLGLAGVRPEEVTARVVLHLERYAEYLTATYGHDRLPGGARDVSGWRDLSRSKIGFSSAEGLRGWLAGTQAERFGVGPAVVLGQDLAEVPGPVGDGAVAELAARDRKMGDGHRGSSGNLNCSSPLMMAAPPQ
jgi:hypothetical protein